MRHSKPILANEIVNLTGSTIKMYDEFTGVIRKFKPTDMEDVKFKILNSTKTQYVVDCRFRIYELIARGCDIDNISMLKCRAKGRNNQTISYLVWARDFKTKVGYLECR